MKLFHILQRGCRSCWKVSCYFSLLLRHSLFSYILESILQEIPRQYLRHSCFGFCRSRHGWVIIGRSSSKEIWKVGIQFLNFFFWGGGAIFFITLVSIDFMQFILEHYLEKFGTLQCVKCNLPKQKNLFTIKK